MKFNVLIGMKHFTQIIMMASLAFYAIVISNSSKPSDEVSNEMSSCNVQKKKNRKISTKRKDAKRKDKNTIIKEKKRNYKREIQTIKKRKSNLDTSKNKSW